MGAIYPLKRKQHIETIPTRESNLRNHEQYSPLLASVNCIPTSLSPCMPPHQPASALLTSCLEDHLLVLAALLPRTTTRSGLGRKLGRVQQYVEEAHRAPGLRLYPCPVLEGHHVVPACLSCCQRLHLSTLSPAHRAVLNLASSSSISDRRSDPLNPLFVGPSTPWGHPSNPVPL